MFNKNNSIDNENNNMDINNKYNIKNNINNNLNNNRNINKNNNLINSNLINSQDITQNIEKKDIIEELIEKIKSNQRIEINKETCKETISKLDEELKKGLEKINDSSTNKNKICAVDMNKVSISDNINKNRKYKNILSEINETIKELNNQINSKNSNYLNYKNIQIMRPEKYFRANKSRNFNKTLNKNNSGFYVSSIDGKLIVNGERKNLPNTTCTCSNDNFNKICTNNANYVSNKMTNRFYTNWRKNYSFDTNKKQIVDIDNIPNYRIGKINRYNRNYFKQELAKINNLLFSKN